VETEGNTLAARVADSQDEENAGEVLELIGPRPIRLCVVDSPELGEAYPRLAECALDVMAFVPSIDQISLALLGEYDAALIGCGVLELDSPSFQDQVMRLARVLPAIAVVPTGTDAATAARLGFRGLVNRDVSPEALTRTVRAVSQGEFAFPRAAVATLFGLLAFLPASLTRETASVPLTPRQQQIVDLIAQGATDREIALRLGISESTAHKHVQNALRRSKTKTRSQLVAIARQSGMQQAQAPA
jgi:DNA-binding NarL/FixJ family response regulator